MRRAALLLLLAAMLTLRCANRATHAVEVVEFWGLGREGEVVAELVPEFQKRNPGIRVDVQQIPWTAAHEKLLTAHVGKSLPDISQMGNTWIPEFVTIGALEPLEPFLTPAVPQDDYFDGIWQTNVVDGKLYGIPWYVDTRVLFYRSDLLAAAGFPNAPKTWSEWLRVMQTLRDRSGDPDFYPILLPTNEWPQPVIMALETGARFVDEKTADPLFTEPGFVKGFDFYLSMFRRRFAPVVSGSQIANLYQQFGEGQFTMFITGPWNVGELRRRLPEEMQQKWATAPMPAPDGTPYPGLSLAGGASLVLFKGSEKNEAAWKLIEFLSQPEQQVRFYEKSGDLPARKSAWNTPGIASDDKVRAFREQLERVAPMPRLPEWEHIATTIFEQGEAAVRGGWDAKRAGEILDRKVEQMLSKRRWVLEREKMEGK